MPDTTTCTSWHEHTAFRGFFNLHRSEIVLLSSSYPACCLLHYSALFYAHQTSTGSPDPVTSWIPLSVRTGSSQPVFLERQLLRRMELPTRIAKS